MVKSFGGRYLAGTLIAASLLITGAPSLAKRKAWVPNARTAIDNQYARYKYEPGAAPANYRKLPYSAGLSQALNRQGGLEYDPFCQCQDYDPDAFKYQITRLSVQGLRATADITISASDKHTSYISLRLVRVQNGPWLVDDIIDETGSIRAPNDYG